MHSLFHHRERSRSEGMLGWRLAAAEPGVTVAVAVVVLGGAKSLGDGSGGRN